MNRCTTLLRCVSIGCLLAGDLTPARSAAPSFSSDLAPVLVRQCLTCHGPSKAKGGYRLDTLDRLFAPGKSGANPILPGNPEASHLLELLTTSDEDDRMPQDGDPLPEATIRALRDWIAAGAPVDPGPTNRSLLRMVPPPSVAIAPERYRRPAPVTALAASPSGLEVFSGGHGELLHWRASDGHLIERIAGFHRHIHAIHIAPGGQRLAVAHGVDGRWGELTLVDLTAAGARSHRKLDDHLDVFPDLAFSLDGTRLAAGCSDGSIRVYGIDGDRPPAVYPLHSDWVTAIAWTPDGQHLVSVSRDRTARVIRAVDGVIEATYTGHTAPILGLLLSADGKTAYTHGRERRIHIWRLEDGRKIGEKGPLEDPITVMTGGSNQLFAATALGRLIRIPSDKGEPAALLGLGSVWVHRLLNAATIPPHGVLVLGTHEGEVLTVSEGNVLRRWFNTP